MLLKKGGLCQGGAYVRSPVNIGLISILNMCIHNEIWWIIQGKANSVSRGCFEFIST